MIDGAGITPAPALPANVHNVHGYDTHSLPPPLRLESQKSQKSHHLRAHMRVRARASANPGFPDNLKERRSHGIESWL